MWRFGDYEIRGDPRKPGLPETGGRRDTGSKPRESARLERDQLPAEWQQRSGFLFAHDRFGNRHAHL
jgi:hypothetical protein